MKAQLEPIGHANQAITAAVAGGIPVTKTGLALRQAAAARGRGGARWWMKGAGWDSRRRRPGSCFAVKRAGAGNNLIEDYQRSAAGRYREDPGKRFSASNLDRGSFRSVLALWPRCTPALHAAQLHFWFCSTEYCSQL